MTLADRVAGARERLVAAGHPARGRGARRRGAGAPRARLGPRRLLVRPRDDAAARFRRSPFARARSRGAPARAGRLHHRRSASSGASTFEVTPDVLIPRPETELIVEEALALVPAGRTPGARSSTSAPAAAAWPSRSRTNSPRPAIAAVHLGGGAGRRQAERGYATGWPIASTSVRATCSSAVSETARPDRLEPALRGRGATRAGCSPRSRGYEPPVALFAGDGRPRRVRAAVPAGRRTRLAPAGVSSLNSASDQDDRVAATGGRGMDGRAPRAPGSAGIPRIAGHRRSARHEREAGA